MQIDSGVLDVGVAEQQLDRAEIGSGFEQMRGIGMPQGVRADFFLDASAPDSFSTGMPDAFSSNRHVLAVVGSSGWKQIRPRLLPAPILAQSLQQLWA